MQYHIFTGKTSFICLYYGRFLCNWIVRKKYRLYTFQNVMTENMVKTVLTHVVTVLALMSVIKRMVFVQDPVHLVSKDFNVFLVLSLILFYYHFIVFLNHFWW